MLQRSGESDGILTMLSQQTTMLSHQTMVSQQTIAQSVVFCGFGLHTGAPVRMTLRPAPADAGVVIRRTDVTGIDNLIIARWDTVVPARLCTMVANGDGVSVSTIEHIMAALAGCAIQNVVIEIDGPEVPILDGSAAPFVQKILQAGISQLDAPLRAIAVHKVVEVRDGNAVARLQPADMLEIDFEIDFSDAAIGRQALQMNMANGAFVRELSSSRTFCRQSDVIAMRERGLALGGTLHNAVVFDGSTVLTPGGLRHADEPVRHKMLDALGDLALAGAPILGRYTGHRAGHALTNALLRALFADPSAWSLCAIEAGTFGKLPGIGVHLGDVPRHVAVQ
jgi:UDP-3-O-[3-hydroxymyristoyl] N-acetylglucosamine deacetylase